MFQTTNQLWEYGWIRVWGSMRNMRMKMWKLRKMLIEYEVSTGHDFHWITRWDYQRFNDGPLQCHHLHGKRRNPQTKYWIFRNITYKRRFSITMFDSQMLVYDPVWPNMFYSVQKRHLYRFGKHALRAYYVRWRLQWTSKMAPPGNLTHWESARTGRQRSRKWTPKLVSQLSQHIWLCTSGKHAKTVENQHV